MTSGVYVRSFDWKDRFYRYVNKNGPIHPIYGQCWTWNSTLARNGYGLFVRFNRSEKAHRVSWEVYNGSIPVGLCVCHKCDNRSCVNPEHLFLGTYKDNLADMTSKGRRSSCKGESNPRSKLVNKDILEIRDLYASGLSQQKISARYGVSQVVISGIVRRSSWKHV